METILFGLGYVDLEVKQLGSRNFLIHFNGVESTEHLDRDLLELCFEKVEDVQKGRLTVSRECWLEFRGLLLLGWTEKNLEQLVGGVGRVVHWKMGEDEAGRYWNPLILIETWENSNIDIELNIMLDGEDIKIRLIEVCLHSREIHLPSISPSPNCVHRPSSSPILSNKVFSNPPPTLGTLSHEKAKDEEADVKSGKIASKSDEESTVDCYSLPKISFKFGQ